MGIVETVLDRFGYQRGLEPRIEPSFTAGTRGPQNSSIEDRNVPITTEQLTTILSGGQTYAGPPVSERSAVRSTAVYGCVSLVSGLMGGLPLHIYKNTAKGPVLADNHRLYPLLNGSPNPDTGLTRVIWCSLMGTHLQLAGNHYTALEYDGAGRVIGFVPFQPWNVEVRVKPQGMGYRRSYIMRMTNGTAYELDQDEVIHVPGLGFDGVKGISPIQHVGRQSISTSLGMEESAGRMLANGARISGIVTQGPGKPLSPAALTEIKAEFRRQYQASINSGEVMFLDNGMEFKEAQMTAKDAELLDSRKFSVVDICRIFGVPPFLIGETADMTAWGSGLEQITNGFLLFGLNRWLEPIEAELNLKLFSGTDYFVRFDRDALNAMNSTTQADAFQKRIASGWSLNEARRKQNMTAVDGGDDPLVPVNYQTLSKANAAAPVAPTATPPPQGLAA